MLSSPQQCVAVKKIDFCVTYDNTTAINLCLECDPKYYVQGNQCLLRLIQIEKCKVYEKRQDACAICEDTFVLTDDKLKCRPHIENCGVYEASTEQTVSLTCKTCLPTFYAINNTCVAGTIPNCHIYAS